MFKKLVAMAAISMMVGCAQLPIEQRLMRGSSEDVYQLGLMYFYGKGVTPHRDMAIKHLTAAAGRGSVGARYQLGIIYDQAGDMNEAIHWYKETAKTNDMAHPMYRLAEIYHYGIGVEKDVDVAIKYYLKTAKLGYECSMERLSKLYYEKRNFKDSFVWAKVVELSGAKGARPLVERASFEMEPLEVLKLEGKAELYAELYLHKY